MMKKMFGLFLIIVLAGFTAAQTVEFQVDMGVQAFKGNFDPNTDAVKLAGNFNSWNNGADVLTDVDGDTVYTISKTFNEGDTLFFKFIMGVDGWENDPNREYIVPAGTTTYFCYFNNDSLYLVLTPVDVTFACNMEFEIVSGRFDPATDTLSARGSFNGWSGEDIMSISIGDPNVYEVTKTINTFEGETFNYKYAYITGHGTTWENDPNKTYTITADDITFGVAYTLRTFNDATLSTVTNYPCTIKFTVDMDGAVSSVTGQPFPSIDNVVVCGANAPLAWPGGGWPDSDSLLAIKLYDNGTEGDVTAGDNIWSRDITFPQYSPFHIQYKYGANWGLPSNTGANDNESSVGTDHFITLSALMISATVENVWSVMGEHDLVDIVLDVNELPGAPTTYALAQNFPNPFNPATSIRFSIPESGVVTLKVYNIMGEEVTTLLNEYKNSGNYEVQFDASKLPSGVYLYSISTNNFVSTKKMILMK